MFPGRHVHSLDAKGRVSIPASFRETLVRTYDDERLIITNFFNNCLRAYPIRDWKKIVEKVSKLAILNPQGLAFERFFISGATECAPDKQGRILLPTSLRDFASLNKSVVLAGMSYYFELWDEGLWEEAFNQSQKNLEQWMTDASQNSDQNIFTSGGLDL
ncbi:MAG: division/cell wall cluster transcriptional repressor MraZ [Mariprofundaceae bacterium]